jgi:hypothetical protein
MPIGSRRVPTFAQSRFEIGGKGVIKFRTRESIATVLEPGLTGANPYGNAIECPANLPPLLL